jgi:hypothetical protein
VINIVVRNWHRGIPALIAIVALSGCVVQPPQRTPSPTGPSSPSEPPAETRPIPPPDQPGEPPQRVPEPVPAPVIQEPVLGAASRSLVGQAQVQLQSGNHALAASSIERALRIEPDNPLLWIELGNVRQAEGNYVQAENMGRRALSLSNAPLASSAAWRLIAESLRARGRGGDAQEAMSRAESRSNW